MSNINTSRLANETEEEYQLRLCNIREQNNWTWQELADIINQELGWEYSESKYRKFWVAFNKGYEKARETQAEESNILGELDEKRIALEKAKYQFYDQRTAYNKVIRDSSRVESIQDIVRKEVKGIAPLETVCYKDIEFAENDMIVNLNDIHYDLVVDNYWNKYSPEIAKKRLEFYLQKIKQKRELYRSENCYLLLGGDNISGNIHKQVAIASREGIVKQIMGVSELIAWFVLELSYLFPAIFVVGANGNHSRVEKKADSSIHDRLDMITTWYLKARVGNNPHIMILDNDIDDTLSLFNVRGKDYLLVHGDLDTMNNPSKVNDMVDTKISGLFLAHKHNNQLKYVQGMRCLMSGSLCGMEDFCVEKRIKGFPQQLICIATEEGIEDLCDINLDIV